MAGPGKPGRRSKGLLLVGFAALLAALAYVLLATGPERKAEAGTRKAEEPAAIADAAIPALEAGAPETVETRAEATGAAPSQPDFADLVARTFHAAAFRTEQRFAPGGFLRVRAIDAETKEPLVKIRVRAASPTRIADRESDPATGEVVFRISPDEYSVLVMSDGYEPTEVEGVKIAADADVTLEPVALRFGSARILGVVNGTKPDSSFEVELRGVGRRRCDRCPSEPDRHCTHCGYAQASTRVRVDSAGAFLFDRLAGGTYAVQLLESSGRAVALAVHVRVPSHESVPVELEAASTRTVRVEIVDTDGQSLAPEWARRTLAVSRLDIETEFQLGAFEFRHNPVHFECTFRDGDLVVARADFEPPRDRLGFGIRAMGSRIDFGLGRHDLSGIDDRSRGETEDLRPDDPGPPIEPLGVSAGFDRGGIVSLEGVPATALTLELASGPFIGSASIPSSRESTRVQVRLTRVAPDLSDSDPAQGARTYREFEALSAQ